MPRSLRHVSIPTPCAEDWQRMTPAGPTARFCDRCAHAVTDFSAMTTGEIAAVLTERDGRVCGRFRPEQLDRLNRTLQPPPSRTWQAAAAALFGATLAASPTAQAQGVPRPVAVTPFDAQPLSRPEREPKTQPPRSVLIGRVVDEWGEPIPGTHVWVDSTAVATATDLDGRFKLDLSRLPASHQDAQVVASFVGFEQRRRALSDFTSEEEVTLVLSVAEDLSVYYVGVVVVKNDPLHRRAWNWLRGLF